MKILQNPDNQFVGSTVEDDVAFGLENIGVPREEMISRVAEGIEKVGMESWSDTGQNLSKIIGQPLKTGNNFK